MRTFEIIHRRVDNYGCRIITRRVMHLVQGVPVEDAPILREDVTLSGPGADERPRVRSWGPGYSALDARRIAQ